MIGAMKKGDTWETEEECRDRVKDMFDIDDVECFWDAEANPPGFVAGGQTEADSEPEVDKGPTEADLKNDKVTHGIPLESEVTVDEDVVVARNEEGEKASETMDRVEDDNPDKEVVFEDPDTPPEAEPEDEEIPESNDPEPSIDGDRVYETGDSSAAVKGIESLFTSWPWEGDLDSLMKKVSEEYGEAMAGTDDPIKKEGNTITLVGKSTASELVTVAICCAKYFHKAGVSFEQFISLMHLRHEEQASRYSEVVHVDDKDADETEV
jgi:hypothetical protein